MQIAGIIAEYNPFHNGHAYQIRTARILGASHIVAVMGGSFTQRGECAALDKFTRAKAALLGGADLVIELPLAYAVSSAERFAYGGVALLDALGCVDTLVFGSECGDTQMLTAAAKAVDDPAFGCALKGYLDQGLVFPKARQLALGDTMGKTAATVLEQPNNILGIEYIKWLLRLSSSISPVTIARTGVGHESQDASGHIASASLIRKLMHTGDRWRDFVLPETADLYAEVVAKGHAPCSLARLERAILARLRTISKEELLTLPDVTEGLEGRIIKAAKTATSLDELYLHAKTKRYTLSRIRRIVLCAFLGISSELQLQSPPYIRVIGFNHRGKEVLAKAKHTATLPIRTGLARCAEGSETAARFAALESAATDVFALCSEQIRACSLDFTAKPVIME